MLNQAIKRFLRLDSMRARYAVGAALLTLLFVSSVWLTHVFITDAVTDTASNSFHRNQLLDIHRDVRRNLLQVEYSLQTFLVSSEEAEAQRALAELDAALSRVHEIGSSRWITQNNLDEKLQVLSDDLLLFREYVVQLTEIRQSVELLFPAFVSINQVMWPQSAQFNTQLDLVFDDLSPRLSDPQALKAYHQFLGIKDTWTDMISEFRKYLASRALSLRQPIDGQSPHDGIIEAHYKILSHQLKLINKLQQSQDLGVQAEVSIQEMSAAARLWYGTYLDTRKIYSSRDWRMDESLMNLKVQPLSQHVWNLLDHIERTLAASSQADVILMAEVASQVSYMLWLRMLLAVMFVVIAFLAFEYRI